MTYKLSVKKYNEVAEIMKIEPPRLKFSRANNKNALAYPNKLIIQKWLAKLIFKDPELVETMIAHELTHYVNQDPL